MVAMATVRFTPHERGVRLLVVASVLAISTLQGSWESNGRLKNISRRFGLLQAPGPYFCIERLY